MNNPAAGKPEDAGPKPAPTVTTMQVFVKDERRQTSSGGTSSKSGAAAAAPAPGPPPATVVASVATVSAIASAAATARGVADPTKRFGLVSHCIVAAHDSGCSHCLSVQELLETYDVR